MQGGMRKYFLILCASTLFIWSYRMPVMKLALLFGTVLFSATMDL